jgi:hypothetical protein
MIADDANMDKMMLELRERMALLMEENEQLKLEKEEEHDMITEKPFAVSKINAVESTGMIPPRSSSVVELLPHVLNRKVAGDPQEELDRLRIENKVGHR